MAGVRAARRGVRRPRGRRPQAVGRSAHRQPAPLRRHRHLPLAEADEARPSVQVKQTSDRMRAAQVTIETCLLGGRNLLPSQWTGFICAAEDHSLHPECGVFIYFD